MRKFYDNLIDYYIERATRTKITVDFLEEKLNIKAQLENSEFNFKSTIKTEQITSLPFFKMI